MAKLIAKEEGFGRTGKLPTGDPNDIGTIDTDEHGWADLERQLRIDAERGMTVRQAIYSWAPVKDGNNPAKYLADILLGFGGRITATTPLAEALRILAGS